jgi:DNA invertase Pin-like site-specific DNA recombinase
VRDDNDGGTLDLMTGGLKIGYARVSTDDQNLEQQRDALRAAGCAQVYEEKISSGKATRPELDHAIKALRAGDTLVVQRLDRLGRSLPELVQIVTKLKTAGIGFESLAEHIDTVGAAGELMFHIFACLAQFERQLTRERTQAGLKAARARGRKGGRKPKIGPKEQREIGILLADPKMTVTDVAARFGVSRTTIYKHTPKGIEHGTAA